METKNKITGHIVRADNGIGVPNLKVIVFDFDTEMFNNSHNAGSAFNPDTQPNQDYSTIDLVIKSLFGPALEDGAKPVSASSSDRLGSVLTDEKGAFQLEFEDAAFNNDGGDNVDRRPDLILVVMGADTPIVLDTPKLGPIGIGSGFGPILSLQVLPSWNAGSQEAFFIKIPETLFEGAGIRKDGVQAFDVEKFFGNLASSEGQKQSSKRAEIRKKIPAMLTPRALAKNPQFIPKTLSASETDLIERKTIKSGVEKFAGITIPPPILYFTDDEIATFGPAGGIPTGGWTTNSETVSACDLLDLKGLGVGYMRVRSLVSETRAKKKSSDFIKKELPSCEEDTPTPSPDVDLAMLRVKERVLGQIEDLPAFDSPEKKTVIDDLKNIKARINELEMGSGPTNVTAFRDFHNLQFAFKDVWTTALDSELVAYVGDLYDKINAIDDDYPNALPRPDDIEDLAAFEEFILSLKDSFGRELPIAEPVPSRFSSYFTFEEYNRLSLRDRQRLDNSFNSILSDFTISEDLERERQLAVQKIKYNSLSDPEPFGRFQRLILDIGTRLNNPYSFNYYAADSVNYGIVVKYRQEWKPLNYQVGRLVSTLPLAPGETRELKITHKRKRTRAEKEMRKSLSENSYESSSSVKSELDVIAKLATDTNFKMSASGSFTLGIGSIESASEFSHNQKTESNRQHRQMSEATRKAAEKVRQEREVSIENSQEFEDSMESTQKIHNPNNEVTVTYLMYELERRYQVHQRLESVTPVIMLALDMPSPSELTEGWVLEHAWILRRALLDDSFEDAIFLIENGRQSDAFDIQVKKATYEREQAAMSGITTEFDALISDRDALRSQIINFQKQANDYEAGEDSTGDKVKDFFLSGGFSIFGGDSRPDQGKLYESMINAAESRLKHVDQRAEELATAQRAAKREAREAGQQYAEALKAIAQKDTQIKQLLLHIRQNIFHYMHAIWEMKHPDQWFFEWSEKMVYHIGAGKVACTLSRWENYWPMPPGVEREGSPYVVKCDPPVPPNIDVLSEEDKVPLGSIAHVDQLLGFKGNYAVFPLKDCTHITDYMMREFADDYFGARDPALDLGVTSAELVDYAKEVWEDEVLSDEDRTTLSEIIAKSLSSPVPDTQEIILPTGQIYMEALKGETTLLEDFKLAHRGLDLLKVQEEVRQGRLENLRRAGRMVDTEINFDDPDVDKYVKIIGGNDLIADV